MPRRRRREVSESIHELESDYQPRKRVKAEEDSSSQKVLSRLKKQVEENNEMIDEVGECYRCQLSRATVFCGNCDYGQQFCDDCAVMRGRKGKDRFSCLICLFLKSRGSEETTYLSEEEYHGFSRDCDHYTPQLGDKTRFFFQGYE